MGGRGLCPYYGVERLQRTIEFAPVGNADIVTFVEPVARWMATRRTRQH